ncbi:rod shape-determining protein MreC [Flavobacterium agricola]|uniref:Cell shape-determining protein MreC n=1 Tax=Flavobacterium agricola TaxID=2870839 RepID=A0ABY6LYC4_9FLAO|nr:rod shape-determining protein MreC [Flavobacterium agricola]UYW01338.1 rod shape-determining protein MreC [Flavobacterium agricola]
MQQIINFIYKNSNLLLFLLLLCISLGLTFQSHSYHRSKVVNSANFVTGGTYQQVSNLNEYFNLKNQNEQLVQENMYLKGILYNTSDTTLNHLDFFPQKITYTDTLYRVTSAKVINNSYNKPNNYLTINKGNKHHIEQDMGVVNSLGLVGIVEKTSTNYATVQSILNIKSEINAKVKNSNHFGSLTWNAKDVAFVQLIDVPRLAQLRKGDTIVTGGKSEIFPEDIPIGQVEKVYLDTDTNNYTIEVRLFNDMTNLGNIYILDNINKAEIKALEQETNKNE